MFDFAIRDRPAAGPRLPGRDAPAARPAPAAQATLTRQAIAWMAALPAHVRPNDFAARHPSLANELAAAWPVRERCGAWFEALLRGGGNGFPPRVALELTHLEHYYDSLPGWALRKPAGFLASSPAPAGARRAESSGRAAGR